MHVIFDAGGRPLYSITTPLPDDYAERCRTNGQHVLVATAVNEDVSANPAHYRLVAVRRDPMPVTLDKTAITADGRDMAVLAGIPTGTMVTCDGNEVEHDGTIEIVTDTPATYRLTLKHPLYLDTHVEIIAHGAA